MWTLEHVLMCLCVCACVVGVSTCVCWHVSAGLRARVFVSVCVQICALVCEGYPGAQVLILRKWRGCQGKKGEVTLWLQV